MRGRIQVRGWSAFSVKRRMVGTSRCDVPARVAAGGTVRSTIARGMPCVAPLDAARTAQRAIPTSQAARAGVRASVGIHQTLSDWLPRHDKALAGETTDGGQENE
jgi:hypothetical protein